MNEAVDARDAAARSTALDVSRSFIVQAPAGSGKTGLLIQRYLALLGGVAQPEAIVAMTFTRKAAGEIRERIIAALRDAEGLPMPDDAHAATTWRLARAALRRDAELGWNLIAHPARLRVQTIDALCTALMRQAPLTAKLGALPRLVERAEPLYTRAAREELVAATPDDPVWQRLLSHLDNDADRVVTLLARMLARREQWLGSFLRVDATRLRGELEAALAREIEAELIELRGAFPRHHLPGLLDVARFAAANLGTDHALGQALGAFVTAGELPPSKASALAQWRGLAEWLLTADGALRKVAQHAQGFPAKGKRADSGYGERGARKAAVESLLRELVEEPGLAATLQRIRVLPAPTYDDVAWPLVEALREVLPHTVARLRTVFAAEAAMDFSEAILVALDALGSAEAPGDLLLAIDLRLEHLLVDEFQDTSRTQCELIERLTAGWQGDDGRTLFVVGDPMQSIYRFRQAEVGLFIAAQRARRIGTVPLEPLVLSRNFRARPQLVEWVNRTFAQVLPEFDDARRGAVAFKPATASRDADAGATVSVDVCHDLTREAAVVVERIEAALDGSARSVAVLVRKRPDLAAILPALRDAGIAFSAVGLDSLAERPATLDLVALTHALLQPDDRLAWLATLRAPWCGLTLPDLFAVTTLHESLMEIVATMRRGDGIAGLSPDGRERLTRFVKAIAPALAQRGRTGLPTLVRGAWLALGGPACAAEALDVAAADRYFALLAEHARAGDLPDWSALLDALHTLRVELPQAATARVQVMTLHRAKGLEFDVVIMPGLARGQRAADPELLLWRQRPSGLLLASLKARTVSPGDQSLYEYLRLLARDEDHAELGRLLYVGCTRARERLHLSAVCSVGPDATTGATAWKRPGRGTALGALWPTIVEPLPRPGQSVARQEPARATSGIPLSRLPRAWRLPAPPAALTTEAADSAEMMPVVFDWARESARQIGIAAHRMLHRVAVEGLARWDQARASGERHRVEREFTALGFTSSEASDAAAQVIAAIAATLADPRGRWLYAADHTDGHSEYALTSAHDASLRHVVLDRSFIDADGTRWIVDFKLSRHEGGQRDAFLDSERERYREQLEGYASVLGGMEDRPIRLGLYFPLLGGWREWPAPR
ncbi:MAG: UvrD-helicase domain-containing protein [Casimicrobiaceae bacterium]